VKNWPGHGKAVRTQVSFECATGNRDPSNCYSMLYVNASTMETKLDWVGSRSSTLRIAVAVLEPLRSEYYYDPFECRTLNSGGLSLKGSTEEITYYRNTINIAA
jgi:hypothetical protein